VSRALAAACAATLLLGACGKAPDAPAAASPMAAAAAPLAVAAPAQPRAMRLRGAGLVGKDGYGFTLCGEKTQRIVTMEPAAKAVLDSFLAGGAHQFQLDAWGDFIGRDKLHIRTFERLAVDNLDCDERESRFTIKASGTEPFWHLGIDGGQGNFSRPDHDDASGAVKDLSTGDGVLRYEMDTMAGRIQATISPGACSDGMADMTYGWNAEVAIATGETLKGCATTGQAAH
jgi:uncharacterized membrane protein